jgi:hypothetical protein
LIKVRSQHRNDSVWKNHLKGLGAFTNPHISKYHKSWWAKS